MHLPARVEWAAAAVTAILLILSFPNFELSFLAWIALAPLMVAVAHRAQSSRRAFLLGLTTGAVKDQKMTMAGVESEVHSMAVDGAPIS